MAWSSASRFPSIFALVAVPFFVACDDSGTNSLTNTTTTAGTNACADQMISALDVMVTPTAERNYVIEIVTKNAAGKPIAGPISVGFLGDLQPPTALATADNKENRLFSVGLPDDTLTSWIVAVSNGCSSAFGNLTLPDPDFGNFSIDVAFHGDPGVTGSVLFDTVSQRAAPGRFFRAPSFELRDTSGRKISDLQESWVDGGTYFVHARTVSGRTVATVHDLSDSDDEPELLIVNAATCSQITKPIGVYATRSGTLLGGKRLEAGESVRIPWPTALFGDHGLPLGFDTTGDGKINAFRARPAPLDLQPFASNLVLVTCDEPDQVQLGPLASIQTFHLNNAPTTNAGGVIVDRVRYMLFSEGAGSVELGTIPDEPPFAADVNVPMDPRIDEVTYRASLGAKLETDCSIADVAVLIGVQRFSPTPTNPVRLSVEHDGTIYVFDATTPSPLQWVTAHRVSGLTAPNPLIGENPFGAWTASASDSVAMARLAIRCKAE